MTDGMVNLVFIGIEPEPVKTVKLAGKDVPLNTKIVFEPKVTDAIDRGGILEILTAVNDWIAEQRRAIIKANDELPDETRLKPWALVIPMSITDKHIHEWVWNVPQNKSKSQVGKLPGRISKALYDEQKLKLPAEILAKIGVIANKHKAPTQSKYVFRITDDLYWRRGTYGDPVSCWFGDRSASRSLLRGMRGLAVQLFDPANPDEGLARAWLIPNLPEKDTFIIFNGYGNHPHEHHPLDDIAAILSAYIGTEFASVRPSNGNDYTSDMFYINGDAYSFGQHGLIAKHRFVDLRVPYEFRCSVCDELLVGGDEAYHDDEYVVYCDDHRKGHHEALSNDFGGTCNDCGRRISGNDTSYDYGGDPICESCYERNYFSCQNCGEVYHNDGAVTVHRPSRWGENYTQTYCEGCADGECRECDQCGETWNYDDMVEADEDWYCPECAVDYVFQCARCDESFHIRNVEVIEGHHEPMCHDCADEFRAEQEEKDADEPDDE